MMFCCLLVLRDCLLLLLVCWFTLFMGCCLIDIVGLFGYIAAGDCHPICDYLFPRFWGFVGSGCWLTTCLFFVVSKCVWLVWVCLFTGLGVNLFI